MVDVPQGTLVTVLQGTSIEKVIQSTLAPRYLWGPFLLEVSGGTLGGGHLRVPWVCRYRGAPFPKGTIMHPQVESAPGYVGGRGPPGTFRSGYPGEP